MTLCAPAHTLYIAVEPCNGSFECSLPSVSENLIREFDEELIDEIKCPPTDLESDEPELESDLHREQIDLLLRLLNQACCGVISLNCI